MTLPSGGAVGAEVGRSRRTRRPTASVPPIVLAILGGWLLSRRYGFWYDELYTAEVATLPLGELWHAFVRGEGTIPYLGDAPPSYNFPYYVVAHLWLAVTGLAPTEVGLRLLSLVAMVAAAAVFTRVATRLAGPRAGLAAGLAMAANPFVVQFAVEARSYGLAVLATSVAAMGLVRWLDGDGGLRLYGAAGAVAGLLHWFALLPVAALAVAAVVVRGRRAARPVVLTAAAAAVPTLAVVGTAVANGVGGSGAEWISDVGLAVPRLLLKSWTAARWPLVVVTVAAAGYGLVRAGRAPRVVGVAWIALPVALVTAVEPFRPLFVDRYLLPSLLGLALLVGLGVAALPRRAGVAALAAVVALSGWATVAEVRLGPKEDVRRAVDWLATEAGGREPIVAAARWDALGVDHYTRRRHPELADQVVLPPGPVPDEPVLWVVRRAKGGVKGDRTKLEALDAELVGRGLRLADERRFDGRYADVLVQRWSAAPA
ncbi:MAG: hypothetical protein ACLGI2_11895 [Acidimicrobiia bacterium]